MDNSSKENLENMSRDELFGMLGKENAEKLKQKLADGTLTPKELAAIVDSVLPFEQASKVMNAIILNFSKTEMFNYVEPDPEKQKLFKKISDIRARVNEEMKNNNGQVTPETLDILFKMADMNDPYLENVTKAFFILKGKVKLAPEHLEKIKQNVPKTPEDLLEIVYGKAVQSVAESSMAQGQKETNASKEPRDSNDLGEIV